MSGENIRIFYDGKGNPTTVQMPIADFEEVVQGAREAVELLSAYNIRRCLQGLSGGVAQ